MQAEVAELWNHIPEGEIWKLGAESESGMPQASRMESWRVVGVCGLGSVWVVGCEVRWTKRFLKEQRPRN